LICDTGGKWDIALVSKEGEVVARYDPLASGLTGFGEPLFSPDGSRIYFTGYGGRGVLGVWWIPADGGLPNQIVALEDPSIIVQGALTVGPEDLYLTFGEYESDIWVMDLEW
jgi:Tol biopolymer transport system component